MYPIRRKNKKFAILVLRGESFVAFLFGSFLQHRTCSNEEIYCIYQTTSIVNPQFILSSFSNHAFNDLLWKTFYGAVCARLNISTVGLFDYTNWKKHHQHQKLLIHYKQQLPSIVDKKLKYCKVVSCNNVADRENGAYINIVLYSLKQIYRAQWSHWQHIYGEW